MEQKRPQDRPKINYACEACRVAKMKCQPGAQPGICKRCHEFKRECIYRTGPRTRRPKGSLRAGAEATKLPPPNGPSKTFSIDFEMPVDEEPISEFEALRLRHESYIDNLVFDGDEDDEQQQQQQQQQQKQQTGADRLTYLGEQRPFSFADMSSSSPSVSLSGTSSSLSGSTMASQRSKPLANLAIKPQFNLESATKLLACFRGMLPHMPCLVLPEDATVRSLARDSPFVLLAILAVTSSSTSLQGHSLYDEEFRKVFGLKFVAGGERSLELLQGILIYCAWYPFHLRPKNKHAFQYLRMAVDIVHDLELDQEPDVTFFSPAASQAIPNLDNLRALLGCFYSISVFSTTWFKTSTMRYTPQLSRSAELLEQYSTLEQDHYLVWLVRQQYILEELSEVQRTFSRGPRDHASEMQRDLIRAGLEAQFRDFNTRMPEKYASATSIRLESLVTEAIIEAPPLIATSRSSSTETVTPDRLIRAAYSVRAVFDHVSALKTSPSPVLRGFGGADYARLVVAVVMAYRLSFPMPTICRDHDVAKARRILDLGPMLSRLGDDTESSEAPLSTAASTLAPTHNANSSTSSSSPVPIPIPIPTTTPNPPRKTDSWSAFTIVLRSVKAKYEEKVAASDDAMSMTTSTYASTPTFTSTFTSTSTSTSTSTNKSKFWASATCPMLNGTIDQYISQWSGQQPANPPPPPPPPHAAFTTDSQGVGGNDTFMGPMAHMGLGTGEAERSAVYHDLWATMTMGWADDVGMEDTGYDRSMFNL
ncbi:hypothetical protein GGR50DRAFT_705325 [Xylaria sp. CBS 124048]|nr:hypothetical protein GGR50DRAFT_705325 [Xylaria sp. CBS 124048]